MPLNKDRLALKRSTIDSFLEDELKKSETYWSYKVAIDILSNPKKLTKIFKITSLPCYAIYSELIAAVFTINGYKLDSGEVLGLFYAF